MITKPNTFRLHASQLPVAKTQRPMGQTTHPGRKEVRATRNGVTPLRRFRLADSTKRPHLTPIPPTQVEDTLFSGEDLHDNMTNIDAEIVWVDDYLQPFYGGRASFCNIAVLADYQRQDFVGFHSPRNLDVYVQSAIDLMLEHGSQKEDIELLVFMGTDYDTEEEITDVQDTVRNLVPYSEFYKSHVDLGVTDSVGKNWVYFEMHEGRLRPRMTLAHFLLQTRFLTMPMEPVSTFGNRS